MKNIQSIIGYFDLDPNRVLDILLDIFTANVTDNWDFFLELLELSFWTYASEIPKQAVSTNISNGHDIKRGRPIIAQILGFKFQYYSTTSSASTPPMQLYWVAAILIRHQLVKLEDLYGHLYPSDEQIPVEYADYLKSINTLAKKAGRFSGPMV